jgi:exodeoxyribonuclease VII small subunit
MPPAKKKPTAQAPAFEDALSDLESATRRLERDDLTLEQSLACFEDGVRLMRLCDGHINRAKGRLMELARSESGDGELITRILGESLESFTGGGIADGD